MTRPTVIVFPRMATRNRPISPFTQASAIPSTHKKQDDSMIYPTAVLILEGLPPSNEYSCRSCTTRRLHHGLDDFSLHMIQRHKTVVAAVTVSENGVTDVVCSSITDGLLKQLFDPHTHKQRFHLRYKDNHKTRQGSFTSRILRKYNLTCFRRRSKRNEKRWQKRDNSSVNRQTQTIRENPSNLASREFSRGLPKHEVMKPVKVRQAKLKALGNIRQQLTKEAGLEKAWHGGQQRLGTNRTQVFCSI